MAGSVISAPEVMFRVGDEVNCRERRLRLGSGEVMASERGEPEGIS